MPVNYDAFPLAGAPQGQPAGPTDASKMPWAQILPHALMGLQGDYLGSLINQAKAIVQHGQGALGDVAQGKMPVVDPLTAGMRGVNEVVADPMGSAKRLAAVPGAVAGYVRRTYTDPGALKNTLYNHPYQPIGDTAGVLAAGGTGLESLAGDTGLASDVARSMQVGSTVLNPVAAPARATGVGATALAARARGRAFNPDGSWTPQGTAAVKQAYPNITDAELADPNFRSTVAKVTQAKGVNPATMREAMLRTNGVQPTRSVVTGTKTAAGVADPVQTATDNGLAAIAAKNQGIVGGDTPDPVAIGAFARQASTAAKASADAKYAAIRNMPGDIGPTMDPNFVNAGIASALGGHGIQAEDALNRYPASQYPYAKAAISQLRDVLLNGQSTVGPVGSPIGGNQLVALRTSLSHLANEANGPDKDLTGRLLDAYHGMMDSTAQTFKGPDGLLNPEFGAAIQDATDTWKKYQGTFNQTGGSLAPVRTGVRTAAADANAGIDPNDTDLANGQRLATRLLHPTNGPALYSGLTQAAGGAENMGPVDDFIRQSAVAPDPKTGMMNTDKLRALLNRDGDAQVFTPDEATQLRLGANAQDDLTQGRSVATPIPGAGILSGALKIGAGAGGWGLGALVGPAVGIPSPIAEGVGALVSGGLEATAEHALNASRANTEMRGAPTAGAKAQSLGDLGNTAADVIPMLQLLSDKDHDQDQAPAPDNTAPLAVPAGPVNYDAFPVADGQASGGRVGYAEGGSVDPSVDELVDRLMKRSEQVKKAAKQSTKPLLRVPDNTMAKALSIAQGAMG